MSDFIDKAKNVVSDAVDKTKEVVGDLTDKVKNSDTLEKAEDAVEDKAAEGGTLGGIADKTDDAIDHVQGTKD